MQGSIFSVLLLAFAIDGFQISSNNPADVAKYFCKGGGTDPIGTDILIDLPCPETDVTYIGDLEVLGCKLEAGGKLPFDISVVSPVEATSIRQAAFTKIGKSTLPLPGLKKLACDGSAGPCVTRGGRYEHSVTANIPPLVPLTLKGKLATFTLADQNGQNLVCINFPVFIPAGAARSLRKKF